jgi:site-specific recombinase XerD
MVIGAISISNSEAIIAPISRKFFRSPLANRGHDTRALQAYLGHSNIQHTVRYTELSPTRFKDFWRECEMCVARYTY